MRTSAPRRNNTPQMSTPAATTAATTAAANTITLQPPDKIEAWQEVISVHPGFQLVPEELRLPTRSTTMATVLPSISAPSSESMDQPTDTQAAIAQAAVAVAMAQSQQARKYSAPGTSGDATDPAPPGSGAMVTAVGQVAAAPGAAGGAQLMMLSNGVVVPMPSTQAGGSAAIPGAVASPLHPTMFCSRDMMNQGTQRSSSKNCVYPGCQKVSPPPRPPGPPPSRRP